MIYHFWRSSIRKGTALALFAEFIYDAVVEDINKRFPEGERPGNYQPSLQQTFLGIIQAETEKVIPMQSFAAWYTGKNYDVKQLIFQLGYTQEFVQEQHEKAVAAWVNHPYNIYKKKAEALQQAVLAKAALQPKADLYALLTEFIEQISKL